MTGEKLRTELCRRMTAEYTVRGDIVIGICANNVMCADWEQNQREER